jgi:hypothetical protein
MNALILAQHHGAFLTMQSALGKFERVIVFVPQSQLDKYATFPDKEFKEYGKMLKAFCKKNKFELYTVQAPPAANQAAAYIAALRELKASGNWAILSAGSIYQSFNEDKLKDNWFSASVGRVFDGDQRLAMYGMIGLEPINNSIHVSNFFVNLDLVPAESSDQVLLGTAKQLGKFHKQSRMGLGRPDPLVGQALSALELLRLRTKTAKSAVLNYWMPAITKNHVEQEYVAYPFDEYAKLAQKMKKYLPAATAAAIKVNGEQSAAYRQLAELEL